MGLPVGDRNLEVPGAGCTTQGMEIGSGHIKRGFRAQDGIYGTRTQKFLGLGFSRDIGSLFSNSAAKSSPVRFLLCFNPNALSCKPRTVSLVGACSKHLNLFHLHHIISYLYTYIYIFVYLLIIFLYLLISI